MSRIIPIYLQFLWVILIIVSCSSSKLSKKEAAEASLHPYYISPEEVSVGDWLTYIVATRFPQGDQAVWLGDHYNMIQPKLPVLGIGGWSDYTIRAFLRPDQKYAAIDFYNECNTHFSNLAIGASAGDSIKELKLMDMPISGITYEQAMQYVAYIQDVMNACDDLTQGKYRYECFLPTPEQFDTYHAKWDSINSKGCNMFNYMNSLCTACPNAKEIMNHPIASRTGKEPTYTWYFYPDPFGLKNYKGNVAEMTAVKGVAKGGSCMHYAIEAYPGMQQEYTEPAMWLGFRVWYRKMLVSNEGK